MHATPFFDDPDERPFDDDDEPDYPPEGDEDDD